MHLSYTYYVVVFLRKRMADIIGFDASHTHKCGHVLYRG